MLDLFTLNCTLKLKMCGKIIVLLNIVKYCQISKKNIENYDLKIEHSNF